MNTSVTCFWASFSDSIADIMSDIIVIVPEVRGNTLMLFGHEKEYISAIFEICHIPASTMGSEWT